MKRLTPDAMDPALYLFLLDLSIDTCLDTDAYLHWANAHTVELDSEFEKTGLPPDYYGGWAREQYVAHRKLVTL